MHANAVSTKSARTVALALVGAIALLLAAMSGSAVAKDRNNDRIPDRWEKRHGLSLKVNQAKRDQDDDELANLGEFQADMDPQDADTDGDGVPDGEENAGEIASFVPGAEEGTGTLTINLYSGETLTGEVTERTTIAVLTEEDEELLDKAARPGRPPSGLAPEGDEESTEPAAPGEETDPSGGRPNGVGQHDCPNADEGSVDDLVPGAVVHQVTLDVTSNGKEFRRIEVSPSA
jgi:hypothetical protein